MRPPIGTSQPRLEDIRLVRGQGRYTDDIAPGDAAWAFVVRSSHAHAGLTVDASAALGQPGVLAVLTARDYEADGLQPVHHAANPPDAIDPTIPSFDPVRCAAYSELRQPPLAHDRVRFVGEAIALVVAETLAQARDAGDFVLADYRALPAVTDALAALSPEAPQLWDEIPGNRALDTRIGDAEAVERAFAQAAFAVERRFHNQRLVNCQMEPRAVFASYDEDAGYTVVAGSQGVLRQRMGLASALAVDPGRIRVISPDVGGGFGPRTALNVEAVLLAWAARRLGRCVRWRSDRTEAFLGDFQGRDQWTEAALAFDAQGRILAMRSRQTTNLGAYPVSFAPLANGQRIAPTCYAIPHALVETRGVVTNTAPTVPYRGAGRPEAHFAMERLLDIAARKLGIDRIELRRRNLILPEQLPYRSATGLTYDSGDLPGNMDAAMQLADWSGFAERRRQSEAKGLLRGIGLANYIESPVGAPIERVELTVLSEARVELVTGTQSTGQGHETVFAQVAAALLELPIETIDVVTGDTNVVKAGGGTHSDRSARLVSALLHGASKALLDRAAEAAALHLGADRAKLRYEEGRFRVPGGDAGVGLFEIARAMERGFLPGRLGPRLAASEEIGKRIPVHPTGCAVCEVEVDPGTGTIEILRYSTVDDVGQPLNPLIVDGQIHGGIAQGVGQALLEALALDADGQVLSASFMDYAVPRADIFPALDVTLAEDLTLGPDNPLRVKGAGEGGITPATAAVINAAVDALSGFGIEHLEMPATPFRVWAAIDGREPATEHAA